MADASPEVARSVKRTESAEERTRLALDRTLLAWWRTGLACYGIGIAVARALPALGESAVFSAWLGVSFIAGGILVVALGFLDTRRTRHALHAPPGTAGVLLTGFFLLLGIACLATAVGRR